MHLFCYLQSTNISK